jgi:hypothetical protein
VLEAVVSDRAILAQLPNEERTRLLVAAGRTVHPDIQQKRRLVRSLRTAERRRAEARDRAVLAQTGIRSARQAEVFVAPPKALEAGEPEVVREVATPKKCYVCKAEYRRVHSSTTRSARAELNYELPDGGPPAGTSLVTGAREDRLPGGVGAAGRRGRVATRVSARRRAAPSRADFAEWKDRLYRPRPRHSPSVDLLQPDRPRPGPARPPVNNACQTAPAAGSSTHLLEFERTGRAPPAELGPPWLATTSPSGCSTRPAPSRASQPCPVQVPSLPRTPTASRPGGAAEPGWACATRPASRRSASASTSPRAARTSSPPALSTPTSSRSTFARSTRGG